MLTTLKTAMITAKIRTDAWFHRVFKEQAGGAEIIATLIIIAVVLVLALAFRDNLSALVKDLWNSMTDYGEEGVQVDGPDWQ